MAAEDPQNIVITGNFHTYIAPVGTTAPTGPADSSNTNLDPAFKLVGYSSVDGSSLTRDKTTEDIMVHQSRFPVRKVTTDQSTQLNVTFMEWNQNTFKAAFGGGTFTNQGGVTKYIFPDPETDYEFALVADGIDGNKFVRFYAPRCSTSGSITLPMSQTAVAELPTVFDVLEPGAGLDALTMYSTGVLGLLSA